MATAFKVFGDESIYLNHVVDALLVVPNKRIEEVETRLVRVKEKARRDSLFEISLQPIIRATC